MLTGSDFLLVVVAVMAGNCLSRAISMMESLLEILDPEAAEASKPKEKNPAAVALGKLGGKKGGKARAAKLSAKKRSEIAKKAAKARWSKADKA